MKAGGEHLLDYLRTAEMALLHARAGGRSVTSCHRSRSASTAVPARRPGRANRELAFLLTHFALKGQLPGGVPGKLISALQQSPDDRQQQIHYFYCLRLLQHGWDAGQKQALAAWYEGTKTWSGGHSFTPFLENIFRECLAAYDPADRKAILAGAEKQPLTALVLAQRLQTDVQPELLPDLKALVDRVGDGKGIFRGEELHQAALDALIKTALREPSEKTFPYLVQGLTTTNRFLLPDVVEALQKLAAFPVKDDPAPYRLALLAAHRLDGGSRWHVVELLRHWSNDHHFGAGDGESQPELASWAKWFGQAFPKEPALPNVAGDKPTESKYQYADLIAFLEKDPRGPQGATPPAAGKCSRRPSASSATSTARRARASART